MTARRCQVIIGDTAILLHFSPGDKRRFRSSARGQKGVGFVKVIHLISGGDTGRGQDSCALAAAQPLAEHRGDARLLPRGPLRRGGGRHGHRHAGDGRRLLPRAQAGEGPGGERGLRHHTLPRLAGEPGGGHIEGGHEKTRGEHGAQRLQARLSGAPGRRADLRQAEHPRAAAHQVPHRRLGRHALAAHLAGLSPLHHLLHIQRPGLLPGGAAPRQAGLL